MAREYALDTQAAKEANSGGKRIKESGKYVGTFKAAWYEQNDKGTESVHFLFESNDGQEAGPLALYTHNGKGETLPSFKTFNAVLTCLKLRGVRARLGKVELYDFNSGSMVQKEKELYPEIAGKPIGVILQREEYEKQDGNVGERMIIVGPFEAYSGRMAVEILDNKPASALEGLTKWLETNPVKKLRGGRQQHSSSAGNYQQPASSFDDDDIPF